MKKIILSAIAVFAFGFSNAQEVKFGAKVALNVASLTGDVEDASSLIGYQIGGFAEFKISDKFAFQPELMYSAQGVKTSYSEAEGGYSYSEDSTYKLGYINIPLMAKYYLVPKFNLEFGPQIGFLVSSKTEFDFTENLGGEFDSGSESKDNKDNTSSIDFGLNLGAGFDFTEKLSAGLRYNFGLSNVNDVEEYNQDIKNGVLSVSLGYKF